MGLTEFHCICIYQFSLISSSLPKSIKKCATNDHSVNEIVLHFLREYFAIYDSDNREGLLQAYHEEAKFSMSAAYPPGETISNLLAI